VKIIYTLFEFPITYTTDGKWQSPYIPMSFYFFQVDIEKKRICPIIISNYLSDKAISISPNPEGLKFVIIKEHIHNFICYLIPFLKKVSIEKKSNYHQSNYNNNLIEINENNIQINIDLLNDYTKEIKNNIDLYLPEIIDDYNKATKILFSINKKINDQRIKLFTDFFKYNIQNKCYQTIDGSIEISESPLEEYPVPIDY